MRKTLRASLLGLALVLGATASAHAIGPDEVMDDPALESRARALSKGLRCVVCQSENIDESNVDLARDMRLRIRELLKDGKSDADIRSFMVQRYGDFVLMEPPVKPSTYALWAAPGVLLVVGIWALVRTLRARSASAAPGSDPTAPAPLSPEEQERLRALLDETPQENR
ncbi:cytochrome c-type biogenesis protein CcmH [Phaeovibrio sulfidiphilus]|uniref:Cytochrome c-type biogenesis protein n=1 Tax=Phaeovibrio sulfidiphilus TaxID=1220600 RepID=A0A8J6YP31_9PROT|nr:cytochrome c-type biogenesis protein [Phaeovibrio sulfidiphilus]MBE1237359.1 cytochrome c-type biogenesis protein CcmH [Phaeovibrio sulfidiphilus]